MIGRILTLRLCLRLQEACVEAFIRHFRRAATLPYACAQGLLEQTISCDLPSVGHTIIIMLIMSKDHVKNR